MLSTCFQNFITIAKVLREIHENLPGDPILLPLVSSVQLVCVCVYMCARVCVFHINSRPATQQGPNIVKGFPVAYHFNYSRNSHTHITILKFLLICASLSGPPPTSPSPQGFVGDWLISSQVGQDYGRKQIRGMRQKGNSCPTTTTIQLPDVRTHTHTHVYATRQCKAQDPHVIYNEYYEYYEYNVQVYFKYQT